MANYIVLYCLSSGYGALITRRRSIVVPYDHAMGTGQSYEYGITWTGSNLIMSTCTIDGTILRMNGYSSTLYDSIYCSTGSRCVTWDGSKLIHSNSTIRICRHAGFTSTCDALLQFSGTKWYYGVTWAGGNLIAAENYYCEVHKFSGFSTTMTAYISVSNYPIDITWAGSNLVVSLCRSDNTAFYLIKYSGFSSTILESATISGSYAGLGIEWDNHVGQASIPPGWAGTWGPVSL